MGKTAAVVLASALLAPGVASGDPVRVTIDQIVVSVVGASTPRALFGGGRQIDGPDGPFIDVNFSGDLFDPQPFLDLCASCESGDVFSPTISISGDRIGTMSVILGDYRDPTNRWDGLELSAALVLSAGSIILPVDAPDVFNAVFPLTWSGFFSGSTGGMPVVQIEPFSFSGTALVQFRTTARPGGGRLFTAEWLDYRGSESHGAPVIPEPATLILLSTGLAGVVGRRLRRR